MGNNEQQLQKEEQSRRSELIDLNLKKLTAKKLAES